MKISQLISETRNNPDNIENFKLLYEKTVQAGLEKWLYDEDNFLSLSPKALECIEAVMKRRELSWFDYSNPEHSYGTIAGESKTSLSRIHFGINGENGWDLCSRINTPEFINKRETQNIEIKEALVACEQAATNYGHFQLVTMARIFDIYIRNNRELPSNNIIIDDRLNSFTKELIEIHPILSGFKYIAARGRTICITQKTYVPNSKRLGTIREAELLDRMWRDVKIKEYNIREERIYIERRTSANGSTERKVVNTDERDKWLKLHRFKLMYMEDISVGEKIYMFRNAEYVVAVEGAALVNICHMREGTKVIELHHPMRHDPTFEEIGKIGKLEYTRLGCASALGSEREKELVLKGFSYHMFPLICDFEKLSTLITSS